MNGIQSWKNRVITKNGTVLSKRESAKVSKITGNSIPMVQENTVTVATPLNLFPYTLNINKTSVLPGWKSKALNELRKSRKSRRVARKTRRNRSRRNGRN